MTHLVPLEGTRTEDNVSDNFFDELLENRGRYPWWKRNLWWPLCRFWGEWSPAMIYRKVKWFVQRGRRGWSDRDIWGLSSYVAEWMPAALRHLKATKHGVPMPMFTEAELSEMQRGGDGDTEAASARWDETMDKMIAGFDAFNRMDDGLYEEELGPYPLNRSPESKARFIASEKLRERDEATWKEGAALFVEHFGSLWD